MKKKTKEIATAARRRRHSSERHRRIQTVTFILVILTLILFLASDIVMLIQGEPLVAIASIMATVLYALTLRQQWRDIRRERDIPRD